MTSTGFTRFIVSLDQSSPDSSAILLKSGLLLRDYVLTVWHHTGKSSLSASSFIAYSSLAARPDDGGFLLYESESNQSYEKRVQKGGDHWMVKAVVFDLDGTLLNREASVKEFIEYQYDRFGHTFRQIDKEAYVERFIALDRYGYVWKDKVYQQLIDELKITEVTWEELLRDYVGGFSRHCVPFPNLITMLDELRGQGSRLGIITNGVGPFQMRNVRALGIPHYFDSILVSESEGIKKPDPRIFERALDRLGVSPVESIYVGDHPQNDVDAAKALGMKAIWKKNRHWSDVEADGVVEDLAELPPLISALFGQG